MKKDYYCLKCKVYLTAKEACEDKHIGHVVQTTKTNPPLKYCRVGGI